MSQCMHSYPVRPFHPPFVRPGQTPVAYRPRPWRPLLQHPKCDFPNFVREPERNHIRPVIFSIDHNKNRWKYVQVVGGSKQFKPNCAVYSFYSQPPNQNRLAVFRVSMVHGHGLKRVATPWHQNTWCQIHYIIFSTWVQQCWLLIQNGVICLLC